MEGLYAAILRDDPDAIQLDQDSIILSVRSSAPLLERAVSSGSFKAVRRLVELGAKLGEPNANFLYPIHFATTPEMIQLCFDLGSPVRFDSRSPSLFSHILKVVTAGAPLDGLMSHFKDFTTVSDLVTAIQDHCSAHAVAIVAPLLDVNTEHRAPHGSPVSPLSAAVSSSTQDVIDVLLRAGAVPNPHHVATLLFERKFAALRILLVCAARRSTHAAEAHAARLDYSEFAPSILSVDHKELAIGTPPCHPSPLNLLHALLWQGLHTPLCNLATYTDEDFATLTEILTSSPLIANISAAGAGLVMSDVMDFQCEGRGFSYVGIEYSGYHQSYSYRQWIWSLGPVNPPGPLVPPATVTPTIDRSASQCVGTRFVEGGGGSLLLHIPWASPAVMARCGGAGAMVERLLRLGVPIDATDCHGVTALHYFSRLGVVAAVAMLLQCGAQVDVKIQPWPGLGGRDRGPFWDGWPRRHLPPPADGSTPLALAVRNFGVEGVPVCVDALLGAGASQVDAGFDVATMDTHPLVLQHPELLEMLQASLPRC